MMDFEYSQKTQALMDKASAFIEQEIEPQVALYHEQLAQDPWGSPPIMESLKAKAKAAGLWNLFLPPAYAEYSPGLTNLEYAPIAELTGRCHIAAEVFNCSAPSSGIKEVLARFGSPAQKEQCLVTVFAGYICSDFAITELGVRYSDVIIDEK